MSVKIRSAWQERRQSQHVPPSKPTIRQRFASDFNIRPSLRIFRWFAISVSPVDVMSMIASAVIFKGVGLSRTLTVNQLIVCNACVPSETHGTGCGTSWRFSSACHDVHEKRRPRRQDRVTIRHLPKPLALRQSDQRGQSQASPLIGPSGPTQGSFHG